MAPSECPHCGEKLYGSFYRCPKCDRLVDDTLAPLDRQLKLISGAKKREEEARQQQEARQHEEEARRRADEEARRQQKARQLEKKARRRAARPKFINWLSDILKGIGHGLENGLKGLSRLWERHARENVFCPACGVFLGKRRELLGRLLGPAGNPLTTVLVETHCPKCKEPILLNLGV